MASPCLLGVLASTSTCKIRGARARIRRPWCRICPGAVQRQDSGTTHPGSPASHGSLVAPTSPSPFSSLCSVVAIWCATYPVAGELHRARHSLDPASLAAGPRERMVCGQSPSALPPLVRRRGACSAGGGAKAGSPVCEASHGGDTWGLTSRQRAAQSLSPLCG